MHLLNTSTASLDDVVEPIDLRQPPADILCLSFSDSDLIALSRAVAAEGDALPSIRLAHLKHLRHPMSVDLWIENTARHARLILVRLLGGLDWWRYGIERLTALARSKGIVLAVLPGEDQDDPRLADASTLPAAELARMLVYFRQGGVDNMRAMLRLMASHAGIPLEAPPPRMIGPAGAWLPDQGVLSAEAALATCAGDAPVIPILFYRSALLANDLEPVLALCAALVGRGMACLPLFVTSLKEANSAALVRDVLTRCAPAAIVTMTAFAAGNELFDACDAPVLQAAVGVTPRAGWLDSPRGLTGADLAMNVVLPELDGRVLSGFVAFKDNVGDDENGGRYARAEPDRVEHVAEQIARLVQLRRTPAADRRIAMLLPDYPGASARTGWAVGLDAPESARLALADMAEASYSVGPIPQDARALLDNLGGEPEAVLPLDTYRDYLAGLPVVAQTAIADAWGDPSSDPDMREGAFRFRARRFGNVLVALAPDRGRRQDRRADYHDASLPPRHALVAFAFWLQKEFRADAIVHMGAHGTFEWLPGKAVALSAGCWPEIIIGAMPVIYPFIVNNPGEAAQAKRRIAAVTLGHLPPPMAEEGLVGPLRDLERLVDEYAAADGLDPRRRDQLGRLILEEAAASGAAATLNLRPDMDTGDTLRRIDAWLCDLKDLRVKDGLHIYGRAPDSDPERRASALAERDALLAALDGRRVAAGPAGSPSRGRRDVLPTGRNLYTADPRMLPTPTAMDLGWLAAKEIVRLHMQEQGEPPKTVVLDLWGSATLRTGGEEIAQGLALLGCQPIWDLATGRVTGIEVLPTAVMGRPRVDVTWRISGLFRDLFPAQIALLALAVRTVASRDESDEENPLAALARCGDPGPRIFGNAPGAYGAGIEDALSVGDWQDRAELGAAYVAAASHSYDGHEGAGVTAAGAFADRLHMADALVHASDNPDRDLLEGDADVAFIGGFAAATNGRRDAPQLIVLDTADPARPCARRLDQAIARIVHGRAIDQRFIAGQMRHGPRGASELLETVDRLLGFAETTHKVPGHLIDLVHAAYVADPAVRGFLLDQNPAAARAMADRFDRARARGLWHPRRNDVDQGLALLRGEAAA